jgi:hypothetical protein
VSGESISVMRQWSDPRAVEADQDVCWMASSTTEVPYLLA